VAKTPSQMVTLIDEAVESLLGSKYAEVSVNGRSFTKQDLGELRLLRKYYQEEALRSESTGPRGLRVSPVHLGGTVPTGGQG